MLKLAGSKRHFDEMAIDLPVTSQACSPVRALRPPPLKRGRCILSSSSVHQPTSSISIPVPSLLITSNSSAPVTSDSHNFHSVTSITHFPTSFNNASSSPEDMPANQLYHAALSSGLSSTAKSPDSSGDVQVDPKTTTDNDGPAEHALVDVRDGSDDTCNDTAKCIVTPDELSSLARHLPRRLKRVLLERLASGQVASSERLFTWADLKEIVQSVVQEHETDLQSKYTDLLNQRLAQQFQDFTKFNEDYVSRQLRGTDVAYLS